MAMVHSAVAGRDGIGSAVRIYREHGESDDFKSNMCTASSGHRHGGSEPALRARLATALKNASIIVSYFSGTIQYGVPDNGSKISSSRPSLFQYRFCQTHHHFSAWDTGCVSLFEVELVVVVTLAEYQYPYPMLFR
jgi:hypothetical protein